MKRRPVTHRAPPRYPAGFTLGLLALSSLGLTGCEAVRDLISPKPETHMLPGAPPELGVDGDVEGEVLQEGLEDPAHPAQGEPGIPELDEPVLPDPFEEIEGDVVEPHPPPLPGEPPSPREPIPVPGGMPMPSQPEPVGD
jgi:hypothetical protein